MGNRKKEDYTFDDLCSLSKSRKKSSEKEIDDVVYCDLDQSSDAK